MKFKIFAGSAPLTSFSDTLFRTVTAALNTPWVVGYTDPTQVGWFIPTGGIFCNNTVGLTLKNTTAGGSNCNIQFVPVTALAWAGADQFAEAILTGTNGAFDAGPAVAMSGDSSVGTQNGYYATVEAGIIVGIVVANVGGRAILAAVACVVGDLIRISVSFGATQNTIKLWKNGVVVGTATDNNAARPKSTDGGFPGIFWKGDTANSFVSFSNFRCGLGQGS